MFTTAEWALSSAAAASAIAGGLTYATVAPASQLFGCVLVAGNDPSQIALTYDDGPNPTATPKLLEVLARQNVHATFFLIGNYVKLAPALTREIASAGHTIGSHTMSHPHLPLCSAARIREELTCCKALLEDTIGTSVHLFRPPYGWRRPAVLRVARELGMTTVLWNVLVGDWKPVSAEILLDRITRGIARNQRRHCASNIVLHDGGQPTLGQPRLATVEATRRLLELRPDAHYVTPDVWLRSSPGTTY